MGLLLERGIIGLFSWAIFYVVILYKAFQYRKKDNLTAGICVTTIVVYLCFSNMTGELNSVFPTLLLVGCLFALLYKN